jgi:hypothetical protein
MLMSRNFCIDIFESTANACTSIKIKLPALKMETSMRVTEYESHTIFNFLMEESGGSLMEYVLIGSIIAVIGTLILLALYKEK